MTRTWLNAQDVPSYTLDLEEWLLVDLVIDPSQYSTIRHLVSAADMHRDLHCWLLAAMERLTARHGTPLAIAPVTLAYEVAFDLKRAGNKLASPQMVADWLSTRMHDCPPLGGNLQWCAGEIRRLAEARGVKHEYKTGGVPGL